MNKFNKKGFTLIEMLVVIAIIAVLVSIVIPVVSNSTAKAKAAADAANLRSIQATLTIKAMTSSLATTTAEGSAVTKDMAGMDPVPTSKSGDGAMMYIYTAKDQPITVFFGTYSATELKDIDHYAGNAQ